MSKASILIVEDKFIVAQDIAMSVRKLGYSVAGIASSGEDAITQARATQPAVILMDIQLKGELDGIEVAGILKNELRAAVVFLTAHSDQGTLERAGDTDPCGYLLKPYDERQLYSTIELALNRARLNRNAFLRENPEIFASKAELHETSHHPEMVPVIEGVRSRPEFSNIIGSCPKLIQLLHNIDLVAKTDVSVHIYGENGTGKELIADALHSLSERRPKPFIKLNCSAIPSSLLESALFGHTKGAFTGASREQEGFIERANGGTLFLDEIGDISHDIQVKLLRVLQNREYIPVGETTTRRADIRIITATNRDLRDLVNRGAIREDFFYRIHVFPLEVPPLRDRADDILTIAEHFRVMFNKMYNKNIRMISDDAKAAMADYRWPGNVRELENVMRRAFVLALGDSIDSEHLPHELLVSRVNANDTRVEQEHKGASANETSGEKESILEALERAQGNKGRAAEILGYSRVTLWKKLNKLGIGA